MATPRPINEDFNQRYDYNYPDGVQTVAAKNGFGTQNARVAYRKPNVFATNSNLSPTQTSRNAKNASLAYKNNNKRSSVLAPIEHQITKLEEHDYH